MNKYSVDQFVRAVIKGRRDFEGIKMPNARLVDEPQYEKFVKVLESSAEPLNMHGADLRKLVAWNGYFGEADLRATDLSGANFSGAYLAKAKLCRADVAGTYFTRTDLIEADLTNIRNIDKALDINRASFQRTIADEATRKIIDEAIVEAAKSRWSA